jgi:hypothetical protein
MPTWNDIKNKLNISHDNTARSEIYRDTERYYFEKCTSSNPNLIFTKKEIDNIIHSIIRDSEIRLIWLSRDGFF